ncbi:putative quinol monooxygenase [Daejeonella oryzae]|uniref:putative quinol monooxygenase n=1 Tax=Daejeonella oryzae TaxID=1122943 RepID=UPI000408FEF4|nr:antibiotic biosynthesis monooxygenase family protein [Daejeonella oryzae]
MKPYLLHGKLQAQTGHALELTSILIEASALLLVAKGCKMYVVSKDSNKPDAVFITEIWDSKEDHDNSLKVEGVRELIMKAMPILNGPPSKGQELEVMGGLGI